MSSVGETLRRERLRKDLGLEQISRETKISARLLDAIEKDQFELLPGGVFAKSFVRQYARFLGLDEEEMAAEVEKAINPVGDLPSFAGTRSQPAFKVPPVAEWEGTGRSNSSVLPALALVVAVMLVCSAVYAWWQRSRRPAPVTPPIAAAQKAPAPAPKTAEPAPVTPAVANNPETPPKTDVSASAPLQEAAPAPAPVEGANPAATLQVSLTADAVAWVQVWADGKSVMIGKLKPSVAKTFAAVEGLRIRTGNAGSLLVTVNGKPAGTLGSGAHGGVAPRRDSHPAAATQARPGSRPGTALTQGHLFLALLGEEQFAPAALLDPAVDFAPELAEVTERRKHGEHHDAPHEHHSRHPQHRVPDAQQQAGNGGDLGHHLGLAEVAGFNGIAFRGGDGAQSGDGEFAAYNQDHHPSRDCAHLHQGNQRRRYQQLVGDGSEQRADGGDLTPAARQVTVQQVGAGGAEEDGQGQPDVSDGGAAEVQRHALLDERGDQQRDEEDPQDR